MDIINALIEHGAHVKVFDPIAIEKAKEKLPKSVVYAKDPYDAAEGADAVAIVTEWNEFRQIDLVRLAKGMKQMVLFDGRNIYEPARVRELGFMYYGVGRM